MQANVNLSLLRGELDQIDDEILALVDRRLQLSRQIAASKSEHAGLKLCPDRQRAVVERLQAQTNGDAHDAVPHIWREIMAHSVQLQAKTIFLIPADGDAGLLTSLIRDAYGSAAPIEQVESEAIALDRATREDAVAVLISETRVPGAIKAFDRLLLDGQSVARLAGRVGMIDTSPRDVANDKGSWSPSSWRILPARQQPQYPDMAALHEVEKRLAARAPLVELNDIDALKKQLAEVAEGRAVMIQGGDCVETMREHSAEKVRSTAQLLIDLGDAIGDAADLPVVHIGRMAGQFAKPRTSDTEIIDGVEVPVYRGEGINGEEISERVPDPQRLLQVHDQAVDTMRHLWNHGPVTSAPVYASHEALLLNAEQAMTHYDERSGRWWAGSGHMLWIGERTRQLDGAHVEYMRGIANPIGMKCGPSLHGDELLRLIERLDPDNEAGRLVLIPRVGADKVNDALPEMIRSVVREGRKVVWCIDPMHGNGRSVDGRKTRMLSDIIAETLAFHDIATAEGAHPGGIHLELTGTDVLECTGGPRKLFWLGGKPRYESGCDPRLNPAQTMELGVAVAAWHTPSRRRRAG